MTKGCSSAEVLRVSASPRLSTEFLFVHALAPQTTKVGLVLAIGIDRSAVIPIAYPKDSHLINCLHVVLQRLSPLLPSLHCQDFR